MAWETLPVLALSPVLWALSGTFSSTDLGTWVVLVRAREEDGGEGKVYLLLDALGELRFSGVGCALALFVLHDHGCLVGMVLILRIQVFGLDSERR